MLEESRVVVVGGGGREMSLRSLYLVKMVFEYEDKL